LQLVAAQLTRRRGDEAFGDAFIDGADDELGSQFLGAAIAELDEFGKLVAGFHVEERQRQVGGPEGFLGQTQEADGILAAGEQQGRTFEFGGHLAHDVDGLGLEVLEVIELVASHGRRAQV